MKLNIVKDKSGKVVATFENAQGDGPSVTPDLNGGHTLHEIEVAENYRENLHAVYQHHSK